MWFLEDSSRFSFTETKSSKLDYRFDVASTSQSSLVLPPSSPVLSDQNCFNQVPSSMTNTNSSCLSATLSESTTEAEKDLNETSNISEPSFSLMIPSTSIADDSFLEEEKNLEDLMADPNGNSIEGYMWRQHHLPSPSGSPINNHRILSRELQNSSVISNQLEEISKEISLLLVGSPDTEDGTRLVNVLGPLHNIEKTVSKCLSETTDKILTNINVPVANGNSVEHNSPDELTLHDDNADLSSSPDGAVLGKTLEGFNVGNEDVDKTAIVEFQQCSLLVVQKNFASKHIDT